MEVYVLTLMLGLENASVQITEKQYVHIIVLYMWQYCFSNEIVSIRTLLSLIHIYSFTSHFQI